MNPQAQILIDLLEADIARIRGVDPALLAAIIRRLDELRAMVK